MLACGFPIKDWGLRSLKNPWFQLGLSSRIFCSEFLQPKGSLSVDLFFLYPFFFFYFFMVFSSPSVLVMKEGWKEDRFSFQPRRGYG
jgi:hypothetical protein